VSVPVIAFFNNKGGVGKTSLVYHLACMFTDLGLTVLAADLDPQANLTAMYLDEDTLQTLLEDDSHRFTVYGCIEPLIQGTGDIEPPVPLNEGSSLWVLPGDLLLSGFEDELSSAWPDALGRKARAFRVLSAFWRLMQRGAKFCEAEVVLMDLGPNLGSINRSALISADYVVVPLSPDLFSLQGLRNLGPSFSRWREEWCDRLDRRPEIEIELPAGRIEPIGYVVQQHSVRLDRPVKSYDKWISRIPGDYRKYVLGEVGETNVSVQNDPNKLALLRHYRSLMPLAQEARKPMFHLKPADGAIGAHLQSVRDAYRDFKALAEEIAGRVQLRVPAM
jgi:chromosome partitioning protein